MTRYLVRYLVCMGVLLTLVLCLTVGVDPYGIMGVPGIRGLTADKPAASDRPQLTKPYLVEAASPNTIVIGSSTVDLGIDPDSPAWPAADRPVFNLAIDGSNPFLQARDLQHAFARSAPKLVMIGVSFEDALVSPTGPDDLAVQPPQDFEARLRVRADGTDNPGYWPAVLQDMVFATFSQRAVRDSILTLMGQGNPGESYQTALGRNTGGRLQRWSSAEGVGTLFADKERTKSVDYVRWLRRPRIDAAAVGTAIRVARARGAQVILFIIPNHVDKLEMFRQLGMMDYYRDWKRRIADLAATADASGQTVPLWDFSSLSAYTTEPVPSPGDTRTLMQWVWEPTHFRPELGTLMVRRMLGGTSPEGLGRLVTPATLPAQLAEDAAAEQAWVAAHPADVARIRAIVAAAARTVCGARATPCPPAVAALGN